MKRVWLCLCCAFLLTGCGRELEERSFPTILTADTGMISEQQRELQQSDSHYRDYSQVRGVIFSEAALKDDQKRSEILLYLEEVPALARNILVFAGDNEVLENAGKNEEEIGVELEYLSKNQPEDMEKRQTTLKEMLYFFHNREGDITIPKLKAEEGKLLFDGEIQIYQEAKESVNLPVPKRAEY